MKKVLALLLCLLLSLPQLATAVCSANEITAEVADAPIITEEKIEPRIVKGYDSSNSVKERGVIYNKDKTVILGTDGTLKGDYVMPDTVKEISPKAFSGCTELTGVKVSSSVTAIAYGAFEKCTKLDRVNMPKSVWLIDEYAFSECSSLYWINFPESLVEIRSYSFYGTALKDIYLDDNIRLLGKKSFAETKAESLYIGKGVLWGNVETFANNSNLKTVYMCEGIESLDDRMFYNCNSLVEINIPNSVKTFGKGVFNGCASLQYLPLGKNQTSINEDYFRYCTSIVEIDLKGKISSIGKSAFAGCTALKKIKGYEEVYTCGEYAFDNCTSLLTLPLGRRQQEILPYTFRNCTSITELNIGPMINSIGKEAFFGCKNLSKISIANGMINIGSHVFEKTNWLDNQPAGSVYIGDNIFYCFKGNTGYRGNFKSDTVYIKEGTTAICGHAFCGGCHSNKKYVREGLTYVYIPDSVYHIGDGAFKDISPTILYAGNSDNWLYRVNKYGTWSNDSYFTKYDYVIPEGSYLEHKRIRAACQSGK